VKISGEKVHGRYFIQTFSSGPEVSVRAFTAGKSVAFAEGKSMDAALATIRNLLDDRDGRERAARQDGIPTAQEFAEAFARLACRRPTMTGLLFHLGDQGAPDHDFRQPLGEFKDVVPHPVRRFCI
jgi:hypothetical protein